MRLSIIFIAIFLIISSRYITNAQVPSGKTFLPKKKSPRQVVDEFLQEVKNNDLDAVKFDLEAGMDPDSKDTTYREPTALMLAAEKNLTDMIVLLVQHGADVNAQNKLQQTALTYAVLYNHKEAVLKLFAYGADPNIIHPVWGGAIQHAAIRGTPEIMKILLDNGARINDRNKMGNTPLYWACATKRLEMVKLLIERGADVNLAGKWGQTPLMVAEARGFTDIINVLHQVTAKEYLGDINVALLGATKLGHYKLVEDLLNKGADINTRLDGGATPLLFACCHGDYGIYTTSLNNIRKTAKVLLDHGANPNLHNKNEISPLEGAVSANDWEIVKLLLGKHAKIEPTQPGHDGILHHACNNSVIDMDIIKLLVEHGAPVNEKGSWGMTPLAWASQQGNAEVVRYLLQHGADWKLNNEIGRTPLSFAKQYNHQEVIKLLQDAGEKE